MENLLKSEKTVGRVIDEATIRGRILKATVPVTAWATACLLSGTNGIPIGELYSHYENYCRREHCPALPRKVWIGAMKLAGFETQSGAFAGLMLKKGSAPECLPENSIGNFSNESGHPKH